MISDINLGTGTIGTGRPAFVIAEAGVNHNGDIDMAIELVDAAATAGADAVKFQIFRPDALLTPTAETAPYQVDMTGAQSQNEMLDALVLPTEAWGTLLKHATYAGLVFITTAFDLDSMDVLLDIGVPAIKVPSGELTNLPFIRALATHGLPMLISTGMGSLQEVAGALEAAVQAPSVGLFHCISAYPTPMDQANLRAIVTMREQFDVHVGWSDHTRGSTCAMVAVALGATVLEKHLTLDNDLPGPDHQASENPQDFAQYVQDVRLVEAALGSGKKAPMPAEQVNRPAARRSLYATRDLAEGTVLDSADVIALRPERGLMPNAPIQGARLRRGIAKGEGLQPQDVEL